MATQQEIRDVIDATNLVQLISESIHVKIHPGGDGTALCPFHDEKSPSFTIANDKQFFHCFGCGAHGDAIDFLRDRHKVTFRQALDELAGRAGIQIGQNAPGERRAHIAKRDMSAIEEGALHELSVLQLCLSDRVTYRKLSPTAKEQMKYTRAPSDDPLEREYEAAARLAKALYALYGAKL